MTDRFRNSVYFSHKLRSSGQFYKVTVLLAETKEKLERKSNRRRRDYQGHRDSDESVKRESVTVTAKLVKPS